jgi:sterol desaturase/sphingolipid hydroxylase (fatty acid hydroxylase superfamily)
MTPDDIFGLVTCAIFVAYLASERLLGNGRRFPALRFGTLFGIGAFLASGAVFSAVPPLLLPRLGPLRVVDLSEVGLAGAAPVIVLTSFFTYWTHRIQHRSNLLWRIGGHQLHHSVVRVDIASAFVFHPLDIAVQAVAGSVAAAVLGVGSIAAAVGGVAYFTFSIFPHWNVRTPHWIGYALQRPEAHCLHHERDVHARNYSDLPLWDLVFGTFANPRTIAEDIAVGFEPGRSRRVLAMLFFVDVNRTVASPQP